MSNFNTDDKPTDSWNLPGGVFDQTLGLIHAGRIARLVTDTHQALGSLGDLPPSIVEAINDFYGDEIDIHDGIIADAAAKQSTVAGGLLAIYMLQQEGGQTPGQYL